MSSINCANRSLSGYHGCGGRRTFAHDKRRRGESWRGKVILIGDVNGYAQSAGPDMRSRAPMELSLKYLLESE
jgi:hypothetical protein